MRGSGFEFESIFKRFKCVFPASLKKMIGCRDKLWMRLGKQLVASLWRPEICDLTASFYISFASSSVELNVRVIALEVNLCKEIIMLS